MGQERWYKGSLHAHTTESDGDYPPEKVAEWHRNHGYDWLVLSDNNLLTRLKKHLSAPLMVPGEEITVILEGQEKAVYVNSVGISKVVQPVDGGDVLGTLQKNVSAVLKAGGMASLCAPYFRPGFDHESLKKVTGYRFIEVFNAHPLNVHGDPRTFSYEGIWDAILSSGQLVYGTATDDTHNYKDYGADKANPGRAWVMTRGVALTEKTILESLYRGDFYSSTGVVLNDIEITNSSISVEIKPGLMQNFVTTFIGSEGRELNQQSGHKATYKIQGGEGYVRARVDSSVGSRAWIQPVIVK